ncbi:hypothetical protein WA026_011303 [Henosepilachna vigintioctopunctata]|uniref:E3 ubiquitin-protein ligase Topors n=1 Tax=Henosepilachna vigintioctopunctata TaxID=420089 RepID=A0AAW1U7Q8_9CUCU
MADSKFTNPSNSTSPPPNCAICLGSCSNKCFSDTCMHQFCFKCLLQWSKIKAECPLCKQPFKSIIHNVKSNEEYEEHIVEQRPLHIIDNEQYLYLPQSPPNPSRQHRFHFRTTFTVNTHGENAIQQMLLSHSLSNGISISNYMPGSWPQHSRRSRRDNISTTTIFRRSIYNNNLWASAPADVSGAYREVTPEYFQANPASRTRLAPWLNRELNALLYENTQDVMQLVDTIMDYLLRYHICSRSFRNLLQTYLGERTDHFVHEFYNFMRSPFDMIGYDRHVIYMGRPTTPTPFIDISEDNSSDVMIVEETPVVIEVSSSNSDDDVIMTSFPSEMPKPQMLPIIKKSHKRSRQIELDSSSSSSSSDREQKRKEERTKRRKKRKTAHVRHDENQLKLAQFVMDASSSSELDDIPLAKYIRIKASIGKKLLKKSSCLSKRKTNIRKPKEHKKSHSFKKNSYIHQNMPDLPKLIDLASTSSSRSLHSKANPRRRDSSSSSSSSSTSSSATSIESRHSKNIDLPTTITSSNTPPLLSKEKKKRRDQQLDIPSCSRSTNDCTRSEEYDNLYYKHHSPLRREHHENNFNVSRHLDDFWQEGPSTSGLRNKQKQKSPKRELQLSTLKSKPQVSDNIRPYANSDQPLELTNHRRYSPVNNMYVPIGQDPVVPSPMLFNMNANLPRNPVVSQSINFYNSPESPDLIDLSISKFKCENLKHDPYLSASNSSSYRSNSFQMDILSAENQMTPFMESNELYSHPSTSRQYFNNQTSSGHSFLTKKEPKTEPLAPEYNVESSNRYWTDFAAQNPPLTSSNDSSSYNFLEQHPRKSVIQNFGNNDYLISYNDSISPKWSSSNSPPFPCKPDRWSESSN